MPSDLPRLFLARHGDTAWTDSRQRTGRTDLLLNDRGVLPGVGGPIREKGSTGVMSYGLNRGTSGMNILLLKAGSGSLKCTLMESIAGRIVARGLAD